MPAAGRGPFRPAAADGVLFAVAGLLIVADVVVATAGGAWSQSPLSAATFYAGLVALIVAGALLLRMLGQRPNGRLMIGIAGASAALDVLAWVQVGPTAFLAGIVYWFVVALFAHLLLRWPDPRLQTRPQRWTLGVAYVVPAVLTLAWQLMWDPAWFGPQPAPASWWLTLSPNYDVAYAVFVATQVVFIAVIAAVFVLIVLRIRASSPARRSALAPVAIAAVLVGIATLIRVAQGLGWVTDIDSSVLQNLAILTLPVAALIGVNFRGRAGLVGRGPLVGEPVG